jgi:hypothetical protein
MVSCRRVWPGLGHDVLCCVLWPGGAAELPRAGSLPGCCSAALRGVCEGALLSHIIAVLYGSRVVWRRCGVAGCAAASALCGAGAGKLVVRAGWHACPPLP